MDYFPSKSIGRRVIKAQSEHLSGQGGNRKPKQVKCKDCEEEFDPGELTNGYCNACMDKVDQAQKREE